MKVNGKTITLQTSISLADFLLTHNYDCKKVAVELNGEIVPKANFINMILKDSDTIEVVSFVGGG